MKFINIGFGNMVAADRVVAVVSPDSAPIKRLIQDAKDQGRTIDVSCGRRTRAVIITDSEHVILSAIQAETIANRLDSEDGTETLEHLCGLDCWLDTSMAATHMPQHRFEAIIKAHGADKILFATDCPWGGKATCDAVAALPLSEGEKEKIFWRNASALLGI